MGTALLHETQLTKFLVWHNIASLQVTQSNSGFLKIFIYLAVAGLSLWHVGSSSLTRVGTSAPCIETAESQPLDHQGSPCFRILDCFLFLPSSPWLRPCLLAVGLLAHTMCSLCSQLPGRCTPSGWPLKIRLWPLGSQQRQGGKS